MNREKIKRLSALLIPLSLLAGAVALWFIDPAQTAWAPKCVFRMLTGLECPGCGSGRAMHQLLHLHVGRALSYNPILALALPYLALLVWLEYLGGKRLAPRLLPALTGRTAIRAVVAILVIYTIVRNLF